MGATRISGYTLDLIFTNPSSLDINATVHPDLITTSNDNIKFDHYPISFNHPFSNLAACNSSIGWSEKNKKSKFKKVVFLKVALGLLGMVKKLFWGFQPKTSLLPPPCNKNVENQGIFTLGWLIKAN